MQKHVNITSVNGTSTGSSTKPQLFGEGDIVHMAFCCMLSLTIVVGNIFVIISFKLNIRLRTVTNIGLVSLAFSDFLVGLISVPLWMYLHISSNDLSSRPAQYYGFFILFDMLNGSASIFQLTAISIERCFSVIAPIRHRSMSKSTHYRIVLIVWILATMCSASFILPFAGLLSMEWYMTFIVLICFVIPLTIITGSYCKIFHTVKKRNLSFSSSNQSLNWTTQRKTVITLLIVTGLFVLAWSPFFVLTALQQHLITRTPKNVYLKRFPKWAQYINSGINPFLYSFRNKEFRSTFKRMILSIIRCQSFQQV